MSSNLVLKKIVYTDLNGNFNIGTTGNTVNVPNLKLSESLDLSLDDTNTDLTLSTSNVHIIKLPVEAEWAVRVDGPGTDDVTAAAIDINSNLYLAGIYNSSTTNLLVYNTNNTLSSISLRVPTSTAAYAVKYNTNGIAQWAVSVDGDLAEQGQTVITDLQENMYLGGLYNSTTTVSIYNSNNVASPLTLRGTSGSYGGFAVKYNSNGDAQWVVSVDGAGNDGSYGIITDNSSNLYLVGYYATSGVKVYNANNIDSGFTFRTASSYGAYATKFSPTGIFQWGVSVDSAGTSSNEFGASVAVDNANNLYFNGYYTSTYANVGIYNSNNALGSIFLRPSTSTAAFLVKYNEGGIAQWAVSVDGSTTGQIRYGLATDTVGNIYLAGSYSNNAVIVYNSNNTPSSITLRSPTLGGSAGYLIKYNTNGIAQWACTVDADGLDTGYAVNTDIYNNVYLTGTYGAGGLGGAATIYNANNIISTIQLRSSASVTQSVSYGIKFNENGIAQWAISADGTNSEFGRGILADRNQNIYFAGRYNGTPSVYNINNTLSPITIATATGVGGFLVKYRYNQYKLINNLTNRQNGTIKYIYNNTDFTMPLDIRDSTNTSNVNTIQIPSRYTEQLIWQNNSWTSLNSMIPVLKGGTGQSNLSLNRLLVGNGTEPVLTPNGLQWDNTSNAIITPNINVGSNIYLGTSNAFFPAPTGRSPLYAARAWVAFHYSGGTGGTITIYNSRNVSSVSRVTTGTYDITFTVPMPSLYYVISGAAGGGPASVEGPTVSLPYTSEIRTPTVARIIICAGTGRGLRDDIPFINVVFHI